MQTEERAESTATATDRVILGLPVDTGVLFADKKGVYKPRIEKARMKLLEKLGFLGRFLDADEKIFFVTTGCSPFTAMEQMTIGAAWLMAVKRAVFVFTNKRLLHIPTDTNGKYRGSIAQILYQDCRRLHMKGSALVAEYLTGKKEKFCNIPWGDRAIVKKFVFQTSESDRPSDDPRRNHLCPHCAGILPAGAGACPSCGLEFKNKAKALKYSLLIPGGGYFYTGHPFMGIGDAVVESYLLLAALGSFAATALGDPQALVPAILLSLVLALEKLVTVYHSHGFLAEFIPCDLKRLLSGQPLPAKQSEPVPPPEIPERKRRPEDVLSVR